MQHSNEQSAETKTDQSVCNNGYKWGTCILTLFSHSFTVIYEHFKKCLTTFVKYVVKILDKCIFAVYFKKEREREQMTILFVWLVYSPNLQRKYPKNVWLFIVKCNGENMVHKLLHF